MNAIRTILSPRSLVFLTLLLAWIVRFSGYDDSVFGGYVHFLQVLVGILVLGSISIAMSAFSSFDIGSKRAFVMDIVLDLIFFGASVGLLAYLSTLGLWGVAVSAQAYTLTITALGLSILDFLISLNGGAGKLLEMDREHFTRDA